jgi:hypothetical protein
MDGYYSNLKKVIKIDPNQVSDDEDEELNRVINIT